MRRPRVISGDELVKRLARLGYQVTRQTGSHMRLTRRADSDHHITMPRHKYLNVGTPNSIPKDAARHLVTSDDQLVHAVRGSSR